MGYIWINCVKNILFLKPVYFIFNSGYSRSNKKSNGRFGISGKNHLNHPRGKKGKKDSEIKIFFSKNYLKIFAIRFLVGPRIFGVNYWFQKEYVFDTIYPYIAQPVIGNTVNDEELEAQLPNFLSFLEYCGQLEKNAIQGCPVPPRYIVNKIKRRRKKAAVKANDVAFDSAGIKDIDRRNYTVEPVVID